MSIMLKVLANYDPILKGHVEMPSQRNATYNSPRIQNEIIDRSIIQKSILEEIRQANSFSVMKLLPTIICLYALTCTCDQEEMPTFFHS